MNPTKNRGDLMCSGRVNSSCFTSDNRRVSLVTNSVIPVRCSTMLWYGVGKSYVYGI
jgi:hypothetical protein